MRLGLVSLLGLALFAWPFLGQPLPSDAPALAVALACVAALLLVEVGTRHLDARRLALLAVLAAIDTALRLAVIHGIGGFSPIFFLILCAGYVFGPTYGFLVGAVSIVVSALAMGGVGPWLPYQIFAVGWVGVAAGLAAGVHRPGPTPSGPGRPPPPARGGGMGWRDLAVLGAVGLVSGWAFGALMDVQDWIAGYGASPDLGWRPGLGAGPALVHFGRFYLATSLAYDTFRAVGNVAMVLLLGAPVLGALGRIRSRLSFEVVGT
jgi:energy-coupling factor transport system substrate-specific component